MNNLTITEHFIELINLMTDIKIKINLLQYDKGYDNVYNILLLKYHDFADIFQMTEKQSLSVRDSHDHVIDLKLRQQLSFRKLYFMFSVKLNVLKIYLDNAMKADIIHKSILSAASSVMFMLKSDDSL